MTSGTAAWACTSMVLIRRPPTVTCRRWADWAAARRRPQATQATPAVAAAMLLKNCLRLCMALLAKIGPPSANGHRRDGRTGTTLDLQRLHDEGKLGGSRRGELLEF